MVQKKYLLTLIGLALGLQAAHSEQKNESINTLRFYLYEQIDVEELKERLSVYDKDELSKPINVGLTLLMKFAGCFRVVKALLECGADPWVQVQVDGQELDVLTFVFKKTYIRDSYWSLSLDLLKKKMDVTSEEDAFTHALKQGMVFTEEDRRSFEANSKYCDPKVIKNRKFGMVKDFIFQSEGCLTKRCTNKE